MIIVQLLDASFSTIHFSRRNPKSRAARSGKIGGWNNQFDRCLNRRHEFNKDQYLIVFVTFTLHNSFYPVMPPQSLGWKLIQLTS